MAVSFPNIPTINWHRLQGTNAYHAVLPTSPTRTVCGIKTEEKERVWSLIHPPHPNTICSWCQANLSNLF